VLRGKIHSFDAVDGLGFIELDDGRRVRFALRHLQLYGPPEAGKPVIVDSLEEGYGGQLRATVVREPSSLMSAAERFEALLASPTTQAYELMEYRNLPLEECRRFGRALIEWTKTHDLRSYTPHDLLRCVPREVWTEDELAWWASQQQQAAEAMAAYEESIRDPVGTRIKSRPDFADIERVFATTLPPGLRAAWFAAYELVHDRHRFLTPTATRLDELTEIARFICTEHAYAINPIASKPFALLPFARGREDSDYLALDLAQPTVDGDYVVRLMEHDVVDGIGIVAATSAQWLTKRR
jgi:hypothetical protein